GVSRASLHKRARRTERDDLRIVANSRVAIIVSHYRRSCRRSWHRRYAGLSVRDAPEASRRQILKWDFRARRKIRGVRNRELIGPDLLIPIRSQGARARRIGIAAIKVRGAHRRVRTKDDRVGAPAGNQLRLKTNHGAVVADLN